MGETIKHPKKKSSLELMRDFYTHVPDREDYIVLIKEVPVHLGPTDINAFYGLQLIDMKEFDHMEHIRGLNEA